MKAISTDAIFTRFSSRVDGSIGFSGCSPELNSVEKCAMFDLQGKNVKLLIQPMDSAPDELVTVKSDLQQKTPSQHLRGILYVLFKQQTEIADFPAYYEKQMHRICESEKAKIEGTPF